LEAIQTQSNTEESEQSSLLNAQYPIEAVNLNKQAEEKFKSAPLMTMDSQDKVGLTCPDRTTCPGNQSCCASVAGYRCCPYSFGSCCLGGLACCPQGQICVGAICISSSDKDSTALVFIEAIQTKGNKKSLL